MNDNLDRNELFCREYVKDFIGARAARRAGVPPASARSWACRALADPEIAARVETLKAESFKRMEVEVDDLLRPLVNIAKTNINDLVEFRRTCCRYCWGVAFGYQRTVGEFRAARARHAKDLKKAQASGRDLVEDIDPQFDEQGGPGFDATTDPNAECPECHGEGVGSAFIKDTRDLGLSGDAYAGVKVTKDGIEVKLHDRIEAIKLLGDHKGVFAKNVNLKGELTVNNLASRMRNRAAVPGSDLV